MSTQDLTGSKPFGMVHDSSDPSSIILLQFPGFGYAWHIAWPRSNNDSPEVQFSIRRASNEVCTEQTFSVVQRFHGLKRFFLWLLLLLLHSWKEKMPHICVDVSNQSCAFQAWYRVVHSPFLLFSLRYLFAKIKHNFLLNVERLEVWELTYSFDCDFPESSCKIRVQHDADLFCRYRRIQGDDASLWKAEALFSWEDCFNIVQSFLVIWNFHFNVKEQTLFLFKFLSLWFEGSPNFVNILVRFLTIRIQNVLKS